MHPQIPVETWRQRTLIGIGERIAINPAVVLVKGMTGKLFGDKGYIGKKLGDMLLRQGLALMTRVRKNMKSPHDP
jgi:hypothetical protein